MLATADADHAVPPPAGSSTGHGPYLRVQDIGAIHAAAIEAGATSVVTPEATERGSERARVLDPEGHESPSGSYKPGCRTACPREASARLTVAKRRDETQAL